MRHGTTAFLIALVTAAPVIAAALQPSDGVTATPIKHVIVVIAENRSFDHVFGVYQPPPGRSSTFCRKAS
jgi:phospholipase C